MSRKHDMSTSIGHENSTMHDRLRLERERLNLSQAFVGGRLHVSRATYIKYENGETSPNAQQLAVLDGLGFDVYFIIVGERSANELGAELHNLFDAYNAAPAELKAAAFAVLLSGHNKDVGACQVVPGYAAAVLRGEVKSEKSEARVLPGEVKLSYKQGPTPTRLLQDGDPEAKDGTSGEK